MGSINNPSSPTIENAPTLTQRQALDIPQSELIMPTINW